MTDHIVLCGLNGSGKSTLGRALAEISGYVFRDIEDYYFPKNDAANPYAAVRSEAEVAALLLRDLQQYPRMILAAVRANYDDAIPAMLTRAIHIVVPREIRLQRIRERSLRMFGDRALPGGDLHQQEENFFRLIAARTDDHVRKWLDASGLPVTEIDGMLPVDENVRKLLPMLAAEHSAGNE